MRPLDEALWQADLVFVPRDEPVAGRQALERVSRVF